jgi:hypothetical protein
VKIFLSYRRSDTRHLAGRLAERLVSIPRIKKVFIDVEGIETGSNFEQTIYEKLNESDLCLILVGDDWTGVNDSNQSRIHHDDDFVRREVATALETGKRIIPVLVDGAGMPPANELPADVQALTTIDAVFLRHTSFNQDLYLIIDAVFQRKPLSPIGLFFSRHPYFTMFLKSLGGVLLAGILLIVLAAIHKSLSGGQALSSTLGGEGMVWLIIILTLMTGGGLSVWRSLKKIRSLG